MTVAELQNRMSHQEHLEWQAFYAWEAKELERQRRDAERRRARRA